MFLLTPIYRINCIFCHVHCGQGVAGATDSDVTPRDHTTFAEPLAHPGEHLREDFLPDYGLTPGALARAMGLKDRTRIERVVREQQPITSDTALRLARVFGTTAEFWMNLQTQHDLSKAAIAARDELAAIKPLRAA